MKQRRLMDPAVFQLAVQRLRTRGGRGFDAAQLVMCEGKGMSESARIHRTTRQNVDLAIRRIEGAYEDLGICPHCGQKIPKV